MDNFHFDNCIGNFCNLSMKGAASSVMMC